ncbi:MAG: hypothetical protein ACI9YE_003403, partial [Psychroserpens sp.]
QKQVNKKVNPTKTVSKKSKGYKLEEIISKT